MISNIYQGDYRKLIILPLILLIIAIVFIPSIKQGIDFTGGTLVRLSGVGEVNLEVLKEKLTANGLSADVSVFDSAVGRELEVVISQPPALVELDSSRTEFLEKSRIAENAEQDANRDASQLSKALEARKSLDEVANRIFTQTKSPLSAQQFTNVNELQEAVSGAYFNYLQAYQSSIESLLSKEVPHSSIRVQSVSPNLQSKFIEKAFFAVLGVMVLSVILVFTVFRTFIPSLAVLSGAVADIILALGAMGLFGIPLTLPSFAALLMLIGFSLDTDILLTMRMLKRAGNPREKAWDAFKTGITMSITAIISFGVLFLIAEATHIPTYYEIAGVALAGLVGDLFATWGINAVLLLWHVESKGESS